MEEGDFETEVREKERESSEEGLRKARQDAFKQSQRQVLKDS